MSPAQGAQGAPARLKVGYGFGFAVCQSITLDAA